MLPVHPDLETEFLPLQGGRTNGAGAGAQSGAGNTVRSRIRDERANWEIMQNARQEAP